MHIFAATPEVDIFPAEKIHVKSIPIVTDVLNELRPDIFKYNLLTPPIINEYTAFIGAYKKAFKEDGENGHFYFFDHTSDKKFFIANCVQASADQGNLIFQEVEHKIGQCARIFIPFMQKSGDNHHHFVLIYLTKNCSQEFAQISHDLEITEDCYVYTWSGCVLDPQTSTCSIFFRHSYSSIFNQIKEWSYCPLGNQKTLDHTEAGYLLLWYLSTLIDHPSHPNEALEKLSRSDFIEFTANILKQDVKDPLLANFIYGELIEKDHNKITLDTPPIQKDEDSRTPSGMSKNKILALCASIYAVTKICAPNNYLACCISGWASNKTKEVCENWVPAVSLYPRRSQAISVEEFNEKIGQFCQEKALEVFEQGFYKIINVGEKNLKRVITKCCFFGYLPSVLQSVRENIIIGGQIQEYQIFLPVISQLVTPIYKKPYHHMVYFELLYAKEKWTAALVEAGNIDLVTDNMVSSLFSGSYNELYQYFGLQKHHKVFLNLLPINNYTDSGLYVWQDILLCCRYPRSYE